MRKTGKSVKAEGRSENAKEARRKAKASVKNQSDSLLPSAFFF